MAILATVLPELWRRNSPAGRKGKPTGYDRRNRTAAMFAGPCAVWERCVFWWGFCSICKNDLCLITIKRMASQVV